MWYKEDGGIDKFIVFEYTINDLKFNMAAKIAVVLKQNVYVHHVSPTVVMILISRGI